MIILPAQVLCSRPNAGPSMERVLSRHALNQEAAALDAYRSYAGSFGARITSELPYTAFNHADVSGAREPALLHKLGTSTRLLTGRRSAHKAAKMWQKDCTRLSGTSYHSFSSLQ